MSKAKLRSVASHFGIYAAGNVLVLAAGFVTFPITTRALSAADFGVLGYWEVWCLFFVALAKLGCSDMIIRFYPHGGSREDQLRYGTNHVLVPMVTAGLIWSLIFLVAALLSSIGVIRDGPVALLAIGLVFFQTLSTLGFARLAAGEHSSYNMVANIIQRWLTVALTATILLCFLPTPSGALLARLGPYVATLSWLIWWILRNQEFALKSLDVCAIREAFAFSIPLALKEISNIVLVLGNRVMLRWLVRSDAAVGIFTIGFSLAMYFEQIFSSALSMAVTPAMSRLYQTGGPASVRELKAKVLVPVTHIAFLGSALLASHGKDLILLISGSSKMDAAPIFTFAGISYLFQSAANIMGIGLMLEKRTRRIFALTAIAAAINLVSNYMLIPYFGLLGAALATCSSQLMLQGALYYSCPAELRCTPSRRTLLVAGILALLVVGADTLLMASTSANLAGRLLIAAMLSIFLYLVPAAMVEPVIRGNIRGIWHRLYRPAT